MTVHQHPRPLPNRPRLQSLDNFTPYDEEYFNNFGKFDLRELVDSISNEGEE